MRLRMYRSFMMCTRFFRFTTQASLKAMGKRTCKGTAWKRELMMVPLLALGFRSLLLLAPLIKIQMKHMLDQGTPYLGLLKGLAIEKIPVQVGHQHGHAEGGEHVDHHEL